LFKKEFVVMQKQNPPTEIPQSGSGGKRSKAVRIKKRLAALKHGAYSALTILPGESAAEFGQLHQQLICEWSPNGVLETETITTLAQLLWLKKNLSTFRTAELARRRVREIQDAVISTIGVAESEEPGERTFNERWHAAKDQARKELGELYDLAELGEAATIEGLNQELEVHYRLDAMIERGIRRMLMIRGLKSMPISSNSAPQERLPSPSNPG
jgi:hypothetical protein